MCGVVKSVKTGIRRVLQLFGYDIVPFRRMHDGQYPPLEVEAIEKIDATQTEYDLDIYYKLFGEEAVKERRFYNIGAGSFYHPAWTNVDMQSEWYRSNRDNIHIEWDLMAQEPLPIESESAEVVYSSCVIEHAPDSAIQNMLNESYRILKNGGYIRIVVPDVDLYYRAYLEGDWQFFYRPNEAKVQSQIGTKYTQDPNKAPIQQNFLWTFATSVSTLAVDGSPERMSDEEIERVFREMDYEQALDYCTAKCSLEVQKRNPGNHMNWFNKKKLHRMLSAAGFSKIYTSAYAQSHVPVLRNTDFFDHLSPRECLFMEAVKTK